MEIRAFWRRKVLLPAMLGLTFVSMGCGRFTALEESYPVISQMRSTSPTKQSLLTNDRPCSSSPTLTIGCFPPTILWLRLFFVSVVLPRCYNDLPRVENGSDEVLLLRKGCKGARNVQFVQCSGIASKSYQVGNHLSS